MRLALATLLIVLVGPALAQDCQNASDQATLDQCAAKDFAAADKALNAAYHEINRRLADDAGARKLLTAAQRDWIAFRDAECAFQTSAGADGSMFPMLLAGCKAGLTNDRVGQLKAYLACEEGDTSCPVPPAQ